MIVCVCKVVSDRAVKAAIASGAGSLTEIAQSCGAGTGCGACRPMIADLLQQAGCAQREQGQACKDCPNVGSPVSSRAA